MSSVPDFAPLTSVCPLWAPYDVWKITVPPLVTDQREQELATALDTELIDLGVFAKVEVGSRYAKGEPLYFRLVRVSLVDRAGNCPRLLNVINLVQENPKGDRNLPADAETAVFVCGPQFNGHRLEPLFLGPFPAAKQLAIRLAQMLGKHRIREPGIHAEDLVQ